MGPSNKKMSFSHDQFVFLRTMGHELRTPLNSIVATCEMMVNSVYGPLQPNQDKAAQRVLRNGNRLLLLINAVMLYIRAEANALELNSVPVKVVELLNERRAQCLDRAGTKGLLVEVIVQSGTTETVLGDPDQIAFIVDELLANAITFTQTGKVQIQVSNLDTSHWTLTIADTGLGIGQDELAQVFTPFWRGKDSKQYAQDGNGLGLAIIQEFIRLMHGSIDLQSQPGKGTTVKITLPNVIPAWVVPDTGPLADSENPTKDKS